VDVDAAIGEHAGIAINPANAGGRGYNALQAFRSNSSRHPSVSFAVNPAFRIREMLSSGRDAASGPRADYKTGTASAEPQEQNLSL
jgi:hypothetical protein